ncbi:MAG: hypothetical protein CMJ38_03600 [Phycisphaerae bacterium]|nr:hypothetical protein [Phycisphaerae bacterium]
MNNQSLQTIERELTALKNSIWRWRLMTLALITTGVLVAATAVGPTVFDHIIVKRIDVIGSGNTPVASLGQTESGGRLDLYNHDGTNLLRLASTHAGGDVALWDANGTNIAGIWSDNDGGSFSLWNAQGEERSQFSSGALTLSGEHASLRIKNQHGHPVAVVASDPEGHGRFQIADAKGQVVSEMRLIPGFGGGILVNAPNGNQMAALAATDQGGRLNILNKNGVPVFIASSKANQGGAISINNERGIPVMMSVTTDSQDGLIELYDGNGNGVRRMRPLKGYAP